MSATSRAAITGLERREVHPGDPLPPLAIEITATVIVAGAIASRDFMPVHHDRDFANQQGAPDIFMNILSSNGHCSRFLTDWAGPDSMVKRLSIRLGTPNFPGTTLTFTGTVTGTSLAGEEVMIEVDFRGTNDLGDHVTGTATLSLPSYETAPRSTPD